ncbi:MAG: hypothetical protein K2I72_02225 [Bacilli bacterium]|nr:hypothetical protein [Bacilli bacterium]
MKLYLISGRARNGKDTLSKFIQEEYEKRGKKVCFIQLMRPLKWLLQDYFGWDGKEETKPREKLQKMGTELIREQLEMPFYFIDRLTENIKILESFFDIFLITDVRLPLEIETLKERFPSAVSINIERVGYQSELKEEEQVHYTELALLGYKKFDYEIINEAIPKLKDEVVKIVSEVEKNEEDE